MEHKPILVLSGMMRSGTTLLASILNSSPSICLSSDIMNWFWHKCFLRFGAMDSEYLLKKCFYELEPFILYGTNERQLASFLNGEITEAIKAKGISYRTIYQTFIEIWHQDEKIIPKYIADKSTHNHESYESILKSYSDSKIIHIVRNPIDVYKSHKKRTSNFKSNTWKERTFGSIKSKIVERLVNFRHLNTGQRIWQPFYYKNPLLIIDEWALSLSIIQKLQTSFSDRILVLKFEDLVENIDDQLTVISAFLGIDENSFDLRNLKNRDGDNFIANSSFTQRRRVDLSVPLPVEYDLSDQEKDYISLRIESVKDAFGY